MEIKHTPGPWRKQNHTILPNEFFITQDFFNESQREFICHVADGNQSTEEIEANAKLIAAAPELLEALTKIVLLKEGEAEHGREFLHQAISQIVWENAKAAIKKATE